MKFIFTYLTALLLAALTAPMNFQTSSETVALRPLVLCQT
jgi:hypothetical protein